MGEHHYTIRQLTKELRVSARTLRYYEDEGLVKPQRCGQTRLFSQHDRARLIIILRGRRLGFSVAEMREVALTVDLLEDRVDDATRAAPGGPEVDQHGALGVEDVRFEGGVGYVGQISTHGDRSPESRSRSPILQKV